MEEIIKIVLADDHYLIKDGIRSIFREVQYIEVVGEADRVSKLQNILDKEEVDVILFDSNLPESLGLETISQINEKYTESKILVFSAIEPENNIISFIDAGASGFILKNTGKEELIFAIRQVACDKYFISSDISIKLLKKIKNQNDSKVSLQKNPFGLTKRELEVLKLVAEGFTNSQIAEKLFTSKRTIESHRQNLIEKTNAKNTASLIKHAIAEGIL